MHRRAGARGTAHAILLARQGAMAGVIRDEIASVFGYDLSRTVDGIRPDYEFNETCQRTVPEALVCALSATGFEDAIRNAISISGDSDTVAALAGSVAEPLFGIPADMAARARGYLPADLLGVLDAFGERIGSGGGVAAEAAPTGGVSAPTAPPARSP